MRQVLPVGLAALAAACGSTTHTSSTAIPKFAAPTAWPTASDYGTIRTAVAARDDALFRQKDWRMRSFVATLALRQLLTIRIAPGSCAQYVVELYGSLRSLEDAYAGEDWRPLVQFVHHQPSLASQCRRRPAQLTA